jgi:hypothetical protein
MQGLGSVYVICIIPDLGLFFKSCQSWFVEASSFYCDLLYKASNLFWMEVVVFLESGSGLLFLPRSLSVCEVLYC